MAEQAAHYARKEAAHVSQPASPKLILALRVSVVVGFMIILGLIANLTLTVSHNQQSNTNALCSLRSDLQSRVDTANAFLVTHPHGFAGVSGDSIRTTITGQKRTIAALSGLAC